MITHLDLKRFRLWFCAVLCTVLWGSAIPMIKVGFAVFNIPSSSVPDKLFFAGIRFLSAGLSILVPYRIFVKKERITKPLVTHSLILGVVQTAAQYFFMYIGLTYTTGVNGSLFNAVGTLLYIVLACLLFKDVKVTPMKLIGCAIGFFGIMFNSMINSQMGTLSWKGDGLILLANLCVTAGFLYSKHSVKNCNPFLLTGMQMFIGGTILLSAGILSGGQLPRVTVEGILLLVYLMIVSAAAFSIWTVLLRDYDAASVGLFNFLTPIFGVFFSLTLEKLGFLNDQSEISIYTFISLVCICGGILFSGYEKRNSKRK